MSSAYSRGPRQAEGPEDQALFDLVEQITDRLNAGQAAEAEALIAAHPEWADRLTPMLPALELLADLGQSSETASGVSPALLDPFVPTPQFHGTLGDYRIVREIGRGGMGVVYEAEEISLRRQVALKVFPFATILDPRQLQRFKNEALAAAQLKHPHIVNVFSVGCERGVHFYAMEYIEGLSLQEILTELRGSPQPDPPNGGRSPAFEETLTSAGLSTKNACRSSEDFRPIAQLGLQAAEALEHAHSLGIVHRDIKPANLMVDRTGQLLITDFGLAQMESDAGLTMTGDVLGTLRYMSPEQAAGDRRRMDHRTDIYSLGATLYELLTLRPMFSESNRRELLAQILHTNPPSLRATHPAISRDLETIVEKATAKDPQDRYPTAREMAEDLRSFLENRPIRARRTTWLERLAKWLRRNTTGVMIALALLILLSVGLIAATLLILREQTETRQALKRVEEERKLAQHQQQLAQRLNTTLAVNRGLTYCEAGQIAHGLLWLVRGLELSSSREGDLQRVIRSNLHDWSRQAVTLDRVFALPSSSVEAIAFSPSGEFAAVAAGRKLHLFSLDPAKDGLAEKSFAHSTPLTAVTFAPDEHLLYTGDRNGAVHQWHLQTGEYRKLKPGENLPITAIDCSPDGRTLFVVDSQNAPQIWKVSESERLEPIRPLEVHGRGHVLAGRFSTEGTGLVVWTLDRLFQWSTQPNWSLQRRITSDGNQIRAAILHEQSNLLVVGQANRVLLYDASQGTIVGEPLQHGALVSALAVDGQGKFLLTGSHDRTARLWDAVTRKPIGQPLEHEGPILAVQFSHDSSAFLTASTDGTIKRWRIPAGPKVMARLPHSQIPLAVKFGAGDHQVITLNGQGGGAQVLRLWSLPSARLLTTVSSNAPIYAGAVNSEGGSLVVATANRLHLRHLNEALQLEKSLSVEPGEIMALAFRPRTQELVAGGNRGVRFYGLPGLSPSPVQLPASRPVTKIALDSTGQRLLTISPGSMAEVWDLATRQIAASFPIGQVKVAMAQFAPDGQTLLLVTDEGRILRFDASTGQSLPEGLRRYGNPHNILLSPNSQVALAVRGDGSAQLFDLATERMLGAPREHFAPMPCVAFSSNGQFFATVLPDASVQVASVPPPIPGEPKCLEMWAQALTGMRLEDEAPVLLSFQEWKSVCRQLQELEEWSTSREEGTPQP